VKRAHAVGALFSLLLAVVPVFEASAAASDRTAYDMNCAGCHSSPATNPPLLLSETPTANAQYGKLINNNAIYGTRIDVQNGIPTGSTMPKSIMDVGSLFKTDGTATASVAEADAVFGELLARESPIGLLDPEAARRAHEADAHAAVLQGRRIAESGHERSVERSGALQVVHRQEYVVNAADRRILPGRRVGGSCRPAARKWQADAPCESEAWCRSQPRSFERPDRCRVCRHQVAAGS